MRIIYFLGVVAALGLGWNCKDANTMNDTQDEKTSQAAAMHDTTLSHNIYDYSFTNLEGKTVKLSSYKGKKILFVNTASECGYTPQYEALEKLSKDYKKKLVIVGFPTNDFGKQEPGSNEEIATFCKKNFGVSFPMAQKITVKGHDTHPIYQWLTKMELNGFADSEVKWNFQKYLVDENGKMIAMYAPKVKPDDEQVINDIKK